MRRFAALLALCLSTPLTAAQAQPPPTGLFVNLVDIDAGAKTSRFDYASLDPQTGRLFIANMGAGKLMVVDVRQEKLLAALEGFPKTTGVLAVPALGRVYASVPGAGLGATLSVGLGMAGLSKGSGALAVIDETSLRLIAKAPAGVFPDGIAYDPADRRIFVSDELGRAVTALDADGHVLKRIALGGEVGNVQYDAETGRIYAPIQSQNQLAVIDPVALTLMDHFPLPGGKHPHGLRLAKGGRFAYAACDDDDRLLVIDLAGRRVVANLPLGRDPDVLAADPGLNRLYVASESGMLSVFDTADPAAPKKLGDVEVGDNAHSLAVDPATHRLYLPLRDLAGRAVIRVLSPRY